MDPWLEGPLWTNVHTQLSVEIARQLAPRLRPRYVPLTEKVFLLDTMGAEEGVAITTLDVRPDVAVASTGFGPGGAAAAGAALAPPPLRVPTVMPARVPHVTIEIREVERRRLVTAIEVLSPTNKRGGRREYLRKRRRILLSRAHLMEIDLLRTGRRVPMQEPLPNAPYFAFVSRAEERPLTGVWPIQLTTPLPPLPVPLLAGDPDVELDLQAALNSTYDGFSYDLAIDYNRPPRVPLGPDEAAWAQERLRVWRAAAGPNPGA
jgi:hypothetical protein